jgi:hypothetical protein
MQVTSVCVGATRIPPRESRDMLRERDDAARVRLLDPDTGQ